MALFTKCILHKPEPEDGLRISIMSRHTLNDGKTADDRITADSFKLHCTDLAPSLKLIGDYRKRNLSWGDFEKRFNEELLSVPVLQKLLEISELALSQNVTLLCIEETAEHCHRRLVAEFCTTLQPGLIVEHH